MSNIGITIAIGDSSWGERALNWALSVKANDSEQKLAIIHNASAISTVEKQINRHFDYVVPIRELKETQNPRAESFRLKTDLLDLVNMNYGNRYIYMDADTIMLPGRKLSELFIETEHRHFTFFTNDVLEYGVGRSRDGHTFFCDPDKANNYWNLKDSITGQHFLPQTDASFIHFDNSPHSKAIFDMAEEVMRDTKFPYQKYKGCKLAELCFNIACAKVGIRPADNATYYPIFLEAFEGFQPIEHIQHQYKAFGFAGVNRPSNALIAYYNKLSGYYRRHFGIKREFRLESTIKKDLPIVGFWHICMINNWEEIVQEQLKIIYESGLYHTMKSIHIGFVGAPGLCGKFKEQLENQWQKIKCSYMGEVEKFEFPTLELAKNYCDKNSCYAFYFHTKGVADQRGKHWRDYLNHFNLKNWKDCVAKLNQGYELTGVKWLDYPTAHFSGNFWWAQSDYIKRLPKIETLDLTDRHQAEFWVGSADPDYYTFSQKMIDHYNLEPFI